MEPDGTGGTTTVGVIWRNGNRTVVLPSAHDSAATALCPASVEVGRLPSLLGREFSGRGSRRTR